MNKHWLMDALESAIRTRNSIIASRQGLPASGVATQQLKTLDGAISELRSKIAQIELQEFREQEANDGRME